MHINERILEITIITIFIDIINNNIIIILFKVKKLIIIIIIVIIIITIRLLNLVHLLLSCYSYATNLLIEFKYNV